jgi:hypothetical protein
MSNMYAKELRERDYKLLTEDLQNLALQVLFPKGAERIFEDSISHASDDQHLARYGIVHFIEDKPHFIHRTFAECYVADLLINQMTKETPTTQEFQDFLLKVIFLKVNHQVVCCFLDGFLGKFEPSKGILEQSGKRISDLWEYDVEGGIGQKPLSSSGRTILHQAAQVGHSHIIRYLLDSLKAGQHSETTVSSVASQRQKWTNCLATVCRVWSFKGFRGIVELG